MFPGSGGTPKNVIPDTEVYQFEGSSGDDTAGSACGSSNSSITLTGNPYSSTVSGYLDPVLASIASTSTSGATGQCVQDPDTKTLSGGRGGSQTVSIQPADAIGLSITNATAGAGGSIVPHYYSQAFGSDNNDWSDNPSPATISSQDSAVSFYESSSQQLDATAYDPAMGTTSGKGAGFTFNYAGPGAGGSSIYTNAGNVYLSSCLDRIVIPANPTPDNNGVITAQYEQCNPNTNPHYLTTTGGNTKTFNILILDQTPEAAFTAMGGTLPSGTCTSGTTCDTNTTNNADCGAGSFDWVICPALTLMTDVANGLDSFINAQLTTNTSSIFGETGASSIAYYKAWNTFRVIGTAILVIAGLIMVSSQAIGFELLDAYTIRKVLPRLLVATIGMSLSWPLLDFVIGFFNTLGADTMQLIYAPFSGIQNHAQLTGGLILPVILTGIILVAVHFKLATGLLLPTLGLGALALLAGLLVIIIREVAITLLVILAPIAIACYVLPNTKKVWDMWKDDFIGLMIMYPIIMALIAAGHVFALVGESAGTAGQIVGMIAYFVPYFLIPLAFRAARGFSGAIINFTSDRGKSMGDKLRKRRSEQLSHNMAHAGRQITAKRADWFQRAQDQSSNSTGFRSLAARGLARTVGTADMYAAASAQQAAANKEVDDITSNGVDNVVRGAAAYEDATSSTGYRSIGGKEIGKADVMEGRRIYGHDRFKQQAVLAYEMRKASEEGETQRAAENYGKLAKDVWGMSDNQTVGTWVGAAFANQNAHLEYKNMRMADEIDPSTGNKTGRKVMTMAMDLEVKQGNFKQGKFKGGYDTFVSEMYEKRGSYNLSQMGSNTINEAMKAWHETDTIATDAQVNITAANKVLSNVTSTQAQRDSANEQLELANKRLTTVQERRMKLKAVAETFVHDGYAGDVQNVDANGAPQMGPPDPNAAAAAAAPGGRRQSRQASAQGAAHTWQRVAEFAALTGAIDNKVTGSIGAEPTGTIPASNSIPTGGQEGQKHYLP